MKYLFIIIILIGSTELLYAQEYSKVLNPADSNLTFKEQAKKINRFFDTATGKNRGGYKQWKRKEWFAKQHLSADGKIADYGIKNLVTGEQIAAQRNLSPANINAGGWQSIGYNVNVSDPVGASQGRVNCIAFHPTNPDIIYIGTAGGGIWKSTSGGLFGSWVNISDNFPTTSISGLTIAPDGNTIYALTGDGFNNNFYFHDGVGVLKSINAGSSWQMTGLSTTMQQMQGGYKISMHPTNSNIVFAATNTGLWRTLNAGVTWNNIAGWTQVTDFEFKPNDVNELYYTVSGQNIVVKLDLTTLSELTKNVSSSVRRIELSVTPASPDALYALVGPGFTPAGTGVPNGTAQYNGLYFLDNWDNAFTLRNNNINVFVSAQDQSDYDIIMHVNPADATKVIIGGVYTYRSTDAGVNFSSLNTTNPGLHADDHAIERNPLNGNLYLGNDGGIYRSTDNGVTWSNISLNLVINEFYRISGYQVNGHLILGGTQDNGHFLRESNTSAFKKVLGGDGMDNIIDYSNSNTMYACFQNGGINKSINGGTNWTSITTPDIGDWITPILQSPAASNTIFYGSNSGVLRSTDAGSSWVNIGGLNKASVLAISNFGGRLIVVGEVTGGSAVKKCDNPNSASPTWSNDLIPSNPGATISSAAINPANADDIYITFSGYNDERKVWRTINGGNNWIEYTLNLPNIPIYSIAFTNQNNMPAGAVYIGTELGVFYKDDNQAGWEPFYNGLPRVPVTDLHVDYSSGFVIAATFGRGLWRSEGHSACPFSHTLSDEVFGNRFYQAAATIYSSQQIPGTAGNSLKLRAANTIRLTNGFNAKEGSYFKAENAACGSAAALPLSRSKRTIIKKTNKVLKK